MIFYRNHNEKSHVKSLILCFNKFQNILNILNVALINRFNSTIFNKKSLKKLDLIRD